MDGPKQVTIPAGTKAATCRSCNARVFFVPTGRLHPVSGRKVFQIVRAVAIASYVRRRDSIETPWAKEPTDTEPGLGFDHHIDCEYAEAHRRKR